MKRAGILSLIILTLWLGAANHCLLETLFSVSSDIASAGLGGHCPSHDSNDSTEHHEGARCSVSMITEVKSLADTSGPVLFSLVAVVTFLYNSAATSFEAPLAVALEDPPSFRPSTLLLASLVSPNAPPFSL